MERGDCGGDENKETAGRGNVTDEYLEKGKLTRIISFVRMKVKDITTNVYFMKFCLLYKVGKLYGKVLINRIRDRCSRNIFHED